MSAALRLNSPLRGSDSGSSGGGSIANRTDGSLTTVSTICFRIHHGCIIYALFFMIPFVCTLPKAPGLPGVA